MYRLADKVCMILRACNAPRVKYESLMSPAALHADPQSVSLGRTTVAAGEGKRRQRGLQRVHLPVSTNSFPRSVRPSVNTYATDTRR